VDLILSAPEHFACTEYISWEQHPRSVDGHEQVYHKIRAKNVYTFMTTNFLRLERYGFDIIALEI
jgi:hypothetical protein